MTNSEKQVLRFAKDDNFAGGSVAALAEDPGAVGYGGAFGVEDGFVAFEGDLAGYGFDGFEDAGADAVVVVEGLAFAGGGAGDLFGAHLVEEAAGAVGAGAGLFDEDLGGVEGDGGDGLVFEVDEVGADEEEDEDEGDHDVVVEAAAFIGPEDVAAEGAADAHLAPRILCGVMVVSPFM
jgi:hypothetical protein